MTDDRWNEIEARMKAATPGPWKADAFGRFVQAAYNNWPTICETDWCGVYGKITQKANGDFIAHAPADIAALLAEVRRLRAEIDNLESTLQDAEQRADTAYTHGYNIAKHGGYKI